MVWRQACRGVAPDSTCTRSRMSNKANCCKPGAPGGVRRWHAIAMSVHS